MFDIHHLPFPPGNFLFLLIRFSTGISIFSHFVLLWLTDSDTSLFLFRFLKIWSHPCWLHAHPNQYQDLEVSFGCDLFVPGYLPNQINETWRRRIKPKAKWFVHPLSFEDFLKLRLMNRVPKSILEIWFSLLEWLCNVLSSRWLLTLHYDLHDLTVGANGFVKPVL